MTSELSGVDLARQALVAARQAAKKNAGTSKKKPKRRTGQVVRRDGREPLALGAAISMMMTERGMVAPAAGGSILTQFDDLVAAAAPELAGHVQAVKFDAATGGLAVVPDSPAYGTKLRWSAPKLIAAANDKAPEANVRALHVLPPAPVKASPATAPADTGPEPAAPAAPVRRRTPPTGYHRALAAHQDTRQQQDDRLPPAVRAAIEAHDQTLRQHREPEQAFADARELIEQLQTRTRVAADPRAQALARARAEKAGRTVTTARSPSKVQAG